MKSILLVGLVVLLAFAAAPVAADEGGLYQICYKEGRDLGGGFYVEAEGCVIDPTDPNAT